MSLHFQFNSQALQEESKEVTFKVEPLMCMEKCARSVALALSKLSIPAQNLSFDIDNKRVTVTMPQSMSEDAIINNLKQHGRSAQVYVPENRMGYGAGK